MGYHHISRNDAILNFKMAAGRHFEKLKHAVTSERIDRSASNFNWLFVTTLSIIPLAKITPY